ncbi:MAG: glucose-6-phosphate dehydrogenase, partial [Casimicrobium sp.]
MVLLQNIENTATITSNSFLLIMNETFDLVIFGGTGDLALRKLYPALFLAETDGNLHSSGRIIAAARQQLDDAAFRQKVTEALKRFVPDKCEPKKLEKFLARLTYFPLDVNNHAQYAQMKRSLDERPSQTVFYLSVGPSLFPAIIDGLKAVGLNTPETRIVLEKPLGRDLQ